VERLWDGTGRRWRLTDDDIPINDDRLFFLTEDDTRQAFYKAQYIFKPLAIELSNIQRTQTVSADWRLPFKHQEKNVGSSGYGVVDRITSL
jgi:hypothetical protein